MCSVLNNPYNKSMDDILILHKIAEKYGWKITGDPEPLHGGLMNKVYKVNTEQRAYVIKLLNPFIMHRPDAMYNFALAEQLEQRLEETSIPILPALSIHGSKMQEIDGTYFYVYDYFKGKALKTDEITTFLCAQIGEVLAKIHGIERRNEKQNIQESHVEWEMYLEKMKHTDQNIYVVLKEALLVIKESERKRNAAIEKATSYCFHLS